LECAACKHRFSTIEISGELLDHLSACKRALEKVTHLLKTRDLRPDAPEPPGSFSKHCATCKHSNNDSCGFDLPEFRTAEADDCNLYEQA
jgi:hypothetical protein